MRHINPLFTFMLLIVISFGCKNKSTNDYQISNSNSSSSDDIQLFKILSSSETNITFNNQVVEDLMYNYFRFDGIYSGAGIGVGDINNDGLIDLYFAGNKVSDKLYLNKGNFQFEDITSKAGIKNNQNDWSTGVSFADVNNDGYLDIYVCKFLVEDINNRKNELYINNGDLTFSESAEKFGLADPGYSIQSTFFDYDKDGWIDMYLGNQPPNANHIRKAMKNTIDYRFTDKLYRNNGNNTFSDVTQNAGLINYSFTLGVLATDLNRDGWPDLYIANDYEEPDALMINNGDGTFKNIISDAIKHMSNFSMGADVADINNDGWPDIYVPDMVAQDNYRLKTNMSGMNPERFWELVKHGYQHQYMFNALHLNNGNNTFSEIAHIAGLSNTDWTWGSLFADFDNDGYKDLHVTNGQLRDVRNKDYDIKLKKFIESEKKKGVEEFNPLKLIEMAPSNPISNYLFKNGGNLTFIDKSIDWGHTQKTFSHGSAYADLDRDGDMDLIVNNMNSPAGIYKNLSTENDINNYLKLQLKGNSGNLFAIGSKVTIELEDGTKQMHELYPNRGYMSCSDYTVHFGLGEFKNAKKLIVDWPDGKQTTMENIKGNKLHTIDLKDANGITKQYKNQSTLFTSLDNNQVKHNENIYNDYKKEILIPHKMSTLGPVMESADVNGDGLDDFYLGGSKGFPGQLIIQDGNGLFKSSSSNTFKTDKKYEDSAVLFFDADADNDLDLYVGSGSNEDAANSNIYIDRLYINDGKGNFKKSVGTIPNIKTSTGTVSASDFDNDGDLDLFIGGRQVPGKYGIDPSSYLLENDQGKFSIANVRFEDESMKLGMVTDSEWLDIDNDNDVDLLLAGEWMQLTCYANENGKFVNVSDNIGLQNTEGWWNKIVLADMDNDGDKDLIAGNLGLNIKYQASPFEPFKLYAKDFDDNGTHDIYLGYFQDGICYPVRGRQCSSEQMPFVKKEFETYSEFAQASIDEVLGDRVKGATIKEVKNFESSYIENLGDGSFEVNPLPLQAQIAPVFGIVPKDWNNDGNMDILIGGNYHNREVETSRSDAGIGQVLIGDGKGNFTVYPQENTGLKMDGDVRAINLLRSKNQEVIVVANNNDALQFYTRNSD